MATNIDIIQAFRQGAVTEGGNCASIALIKAAIDVYGIGNVFQAEKSDGTYHIQFRDGSELSITEDQLSYTTVRADFHLRQGQNEAQTTLYKEIYDYSNLCFCAMVKRVTEIGESGDDGIGDFEDAIVALNDGATTDVLYKILGLQNISGPTIWMSTAGKKGMIAWRKGHTVFVSDGYYDHYGEARKIRAFFPNRMQLLP